MHPQRELGIYASQADKADQHTLKNMSSAAAKAIIVEVNEGANTLFQSVTLCSSLAPYVSLFLAHAALRRAVNG